MQVLDILPSEQAGIKSITLHVIGNYAYGYLKSEAGIHRLIRISPFDANKKRHTSFAGVYVIPEIEDVKIDIKDEDIKVETFRASGPGGQHVNVTDSAVRIKHLPTGITVSCQSERSQYRNKINALKILKARLYDYYLKEKKDNLSKIVGKKKEISWGSQIRSYILYPYTMVKDHRTGFEVTDIKVQQVLDGELDEFIYTYLLNQFKGYFS